MGTSAERQAWLEQGRALCVRLLSAAGCAVPDNVRVTIGWPSTGGRGARIGECWDAIASTDGQFEVFVSPRLTNSVDILGVLAHELIHAAVGTKAKHGKAFKHLAVALGLTGKMTATKVGDELRATFQAWIEEHGEYPAGGLNLSERKKQTTRMLKCECSQCGYTIRTASKWLAEYGPPLCPNPEHEGHAMTAQEPEDEDEPMPKPEPPKPPPAPSKPKKAKMTADERKAAKAAAKARYREKLIEGNPDQRKLAVPEPPKAPETPDEAEPDPELDEAIRHEISRRLQETKPKPPKVKALPPAPPIVSYRVSTPDDATWGTFGNDLKAAKIAARGQSKEGVRAASVVATNSDGLELGRYEFTGGLYTHTSGEYIWP